MKTMLLAAAMLSLTAAGTPAPERAPATEMFAGHQRVLPKACRLRVLVTNAAIIDLILTGGSDPGGARRSPTRGVEADRLAA